MIKKLLFTLLFGMLVLPNMKAQTSSMKVETFEINKASTRGLKPYVEGDEAFDFADSPFGSALFLRGEVYPRESLQTKVHKFYDPESVMWEKVGVKPSFEMHKKSILNIIYGDWQSYIDGSWHYTYLTAEDFKYMRDSLPNLHDVRLRGRIEIREYKGENGTINGYHEYPANEIPPYAFDKSYNKSSIKKPQYRTIILPKSITSIGEYAFANIIDLYLDSEEQWDKSFGTERRYWDDNYDGYIYLSNLTNLKTIKDNAFANTISTRIFLPENLESIGENAFNSDVIKDRQINTNLDSIVVTSPKQPVIAANTFGSKFKNAKIVLSNKEFYKDYKNDKQWGLYKNLTYFGYVSPNPIDIRLDKNGLIINIKDDATETGIVSCLQDGNKVSDIELTTGNNVVNLNPKMEYKISVESEEFNLKPYKVNTKK